MIETILMVWFAGWVLWMLALCMLGSFEEDFASTTLTHALFPFLVVFGVVFFIFIVPISVIISKRVRDKVIEGRKRHISGYVKEEI